MVVYGGTQPYFLTMSVQSHKAIYRPLDPFESRLASGRLGIMTGPRYSDPWGDFVAYYRDVWPLFLLFLRGNMTFLV